MSKNISSEVLERIKKLRAIKGYSQEYMGSKIGMSQKGYSDLEKGTTPLTLDRLEKIAEIFEINVFDLMTFDERVLFNNYNHSSQTGFFGTFYGSVTGGEIYQKLVTQLENENRHLKQQIAKLHSIIEKLNK